MKSIFDVCRVKDENLPVRGVVGAVCDPGIVRSLAQYACDGCLACPVRSEDEVYFLKVLERCFRCEAWGPAQVYFGDHVPSFGLCLDGYSLTFEKLVCVRYAFGGGVQDKVWRISVVML